MSLVVDVIVLVLVIITFCLTVLQSRLQVRRGTGGGGARAPPEQSGPGVWVPLACEEHGVTLRVRSPFRLYLHESSEVHLSTSFQVAHSKDSYFGQSERDVSPDRDPLLSDVPSSSV